MDGGGGGKCMDSHTSDSYFYGQIANDAASSLRISASDTYC